MMWKIGLSLLLACGIGLLFMCSDEDKKAEAKKPASPGTETERGTGTGTGTGTGSCTSVKGAVTYATDVKPFATKNCLDGGCHGAKGSKGMDLTTYAKAKQNGVKFVTVVASKKHQGKRFTEAQVKLVKGWKTADFAEKACKKD